jgi:hypothetical protein
MAAIHALIGVGEGLIRRWRFIQASAARPRPGRSGAPSAAAQYGPVAAAGDWAGVLSPTASSHPDGWNGSAGQQDFEHSRKPLYGLLPITCSWSA